MGVGVGVGWNPWCVRLGAGEVHGALGPLGKSLLPHHFGLWIEAQQPQNCTQERSREAGVSPWPRWADFAWNMLPSEQRLHPIPALSEQSQ